ncbi:MAG: DUF3142 domain-containing protein [Rhodanobacteraceae bacterium]|nr:DUF3142 domain-containing protein [Rhodanobacteraceae bacterium]MBP9154630.1 DUF3142 domain-containing protein [Xanthomonadales bacterium]HQW80235.1 DUF3142 domain-containing protein [Pseudomonadota bacterium]
MRTLLLLLLATSVVRAAERPPVAHDAYIWQRRWTPELATTVGAMADVLAGYRVLVAELDRRGPVRIAVDWSALAATRRPVTLVVRIPGAAPAFDPVAVAELIMAAYRAATIAGVSVVGVEVDHDCARSRLSSYALQIRALQARVDAPLQWSITTLPDWLHSNALPELLQAVDTSVLQVHAVAKPGAGLFDAAQALRWIRAYALITPKPFRVALPAYATRVTLADDGRILAIDSDADTMPIFAATARELAVDPRRAAVVVQRLQASSPAHFAGVSWFRLPLDLDRRAWSTATLRALIADEDMHRPVHAERVRVGTGPGFDVMLRNVHAIDVLAPSSVTVPRNCLSGEGLAGYRFDAERARFISNAPPLLKPGASRTIGWMICQGSSTR